MKKTVYISIFCILLSSPTFCQKDSILSDLDISVKLLTQAKDKIESILTSLNIEYYITYSNDETIQLYVLRGNSSVRLFDLTLEDIYRGSGNNQILIADNICTQVFVRYYHSNMNDLRDFYSYEIPKDNSLYSFEKSLGKNQSHLRLTYLK